MNPSVPSGGWLVTQRLSGDSEKQVDDAQDNGSEQRREKANDTETRDDTRGKLKHQGIDDEPKQPERDYGEGKRENLQDKANCRVDNADDNRGEERDPETADLKPWHDPSDNEQRNSTQQPVQQ
jgi:hypothetical protein